MTKVVVVGADARAHVLAETCARTADVVVSGGNPGIPNSVPAPPEELDADLYVISAEAPLVDGLADRLRAQGKRVYGPGADGARLEGSKAWMKRLVADTGVPTARHGSFTDEEPALHFLRSLPPPWVVKTDGLAAGKGVLVTESLAEAEDDVRDKLSGASFGDAGRTVVIEEGMLGAELSVLAVCDGMRAVALTPAQDFKRLDDGDEGPNTGGMGAFSPVPFADSDLVGEVLDRFVGPTLAALQREGIDYRGTLYAGLMLTEDGPRLLEYNVRFGDPEAQVVLPRVDGDLVELLAAAADGALHRTAEPRIGADAAVCVVCASPGYPVAPETGARIEGIDAARALDGVRVYCAGVAADDGHLVTAGGRVLSVVGTGEDLASARDRAYRGVSEISWPGMHHRTDIALEASRQEKA